MCRIAWFMSLVLVVAMGDPCVLWANSKPACISDLAQAWQPERDPELFKIQGSQRLAKIKMDYLFTSELDIQLGAIRHRLPIPETHQVFSAQVHTESAIILAKGHVESTHNITITLKGPYFVVAFDSPQERASFFSRTRPMLEVAKDFSVGSMMMFDDAHFTLPDGKKVWVSILQPNFYFALNYYLSSFLREASPSRFAAVSTTERELVTRADSFDRTLYGTTYYFQGSRPIGYSQGQRHYMFRGLVSDLNSASHREILQRQMGLRRSLFDPISHRQEIEWGNAHWQRMIKTLSSKSGMLLNTDAIERATQVVSGFLEQNRNTNWSCRLQYVKELVSLRLAQIRKMKEALVDRIAELPTLSLDIKSVIGERPQPNSVMLVRFVWFQELGVGRPDTLSGFGVFSTGVVLHEQMLRMSLGDNVVDEFLVHPEKNTPFAKYVLGGSVVIQFDGSGKVQEIVFPLGGTKMGLLKFNAAEQGPLRMNREEEAAILGSLRSQLFAK